MNTVLITGAAGFLGSHLAEYYLKNGFAVVGIDNFSTGSKTNIQILSSHPKFHFIQSDVCNSWQQVEQLFCNSNLSQLKYVFHMASPASPPHYQRLALETMAANSTGLQNALGFADRFNARLIFASTSEVYGDPLQSPQCESYWGNVNSFGERSCYDESKRFGEALIYSHNKKFKTPHGLVRIFNTYGPRMNPDDGRVMINFIIQASQNTDLTVFGDGSQTRSFCFVTDLIEGLHAYAETALAIPVNLGGDHEISINELSRHVLKLTGSHSKVVFSPLPGDDPKNRRPDLTLARKNFPNWRPLVGLEAGMQLMYDWIKTLELK